MKLFNNNIVSAYKIKLTIAKLQAKKFYKDWETHTEIIENGKVRLEKQPES